MINTSLRGDAASNSELSASHIDRLSQSRTSDAAIELGVPTEIDRLTIQVRKCLGGRPIPFQLTREDNAFTVSAVVPSFHSKQILLRAVQQVLAPNMVEDKICVPTTVFDLPSKNPR